MSETRTYTVCHALRVDPTLGADLVMPGKQVELESTAETQRLLDLGAIEPYVAPLDVPGTAAGGSGIADDQLARVMEAAASLDPANATQFTADGKPKTEVLENLVDFTVSGDLRDQAWKELGN